MATSKKIDLCVLALISMALVTFLPLGSCISVPDSSRDYFVEKITR